MIGVRTRGFFSFGKTILIYFFEMVGKEEGPQTSSMFPRFIFGTGIEVSQSMILAPFELRHSRWSWREQGLTSHTDF